MVLPPAHGQWLPAAVDRLRADWAAHPDDHPAQVSVPVSYTHLDVYKRQSYDLIYFIIEDPYSVQFTEIFSWRYSFMEVLQAKSLKKIYGSGNNAAVSYTHLSD